MFLMLVKNIVQKWYGYYRLHRTSHTCGIWEAASWAWWNAKNPTDGTRFWRNSYLSREAFYDNRSRENEWRTSYMRLLTSEQDLRKKWKAFAELKVETYLDNVKKENRSKSLETKKKNKKSKKSNKKT